MKLDKDQRAWFSRVQEEWRSRLQPASTVLGRHLFEVGPKPPHQAVSGGRLFGSRLDALETLPKGGMVAEIGTQTGFFAEKILATSRPAALHLFDLEFDTLRRDRPLVADDARVALHLGDSSAELGKFADGTFDWIYIDGDHGLEGVRRDTEVAVRKVKPEGMLVFNDYTVWSIMELEDYGVVAVVNELLAGGEWEMVYLALHPLMYCDVGLRRRSHGG